MTDMNELIARAKSCRVCSVDTNGYDRVSVSSPCRTVQLLALPYRDHLDWREEWAA